MPTISEAISEGAARLDACRISEPRRTAGVLLCHVLGIGRTHLLTRSENTVDQAAYERFLTLIERRSAGEPLQYITGRQEFYGLDFVVSPDVLIPRPETEFLVERVIELADTLGEQRPLIVDVGTGSGCIAVAVAVHVPRARLIATDVSEAALDLARQNAERNGVSDRIEFLAGDLLAPLARAKGEVDILASNPPYVNEGKPELIQREVREWEPPVALFGGPDGLGFYRRLFEAVSPILKPGGYMILEIGYSQFNSILGMAADSSWELVDVKRDLQDIPRTITFRRPSEKQPPVRLSS